MACFAPWVPAGGSWKRPLACGQCRGCRLEYSRQWAVRIMHEASLHEANCFVTLTYRDDPGTLRYDDFRLFMRRLRRVRGRCRFYVSGEYGEKFGRPHWHVILFGCSFEGKRVGKSPAGFGLYRSDVLERLWPLGYASFGSVTFESAAYCARYVMKKVTGDLAEEHYGNRAREFSRMSLRPGIGAEWALRFMGDFEEDGRVVVRGRQVNAPRYYLKKLKELRPEKMVGVCLRRQALGVESFGEQLPERLRAREAALDARLRLLVRKL